MKQYLDLLSDILVDGVKKPAARENMPGTTSLFGYQFRHNLAKGFPLLTTKEIDFKNIVVELLWFLRGDTNIKFLVDNNCNIWNEDAYKYYEKIRSGEDKDKLLDFKEFIEAVKDQMYSGGDNYKFGDCGFQYGRVWRKWEKYTEDSNGQNQYLFDGKVDQIKNVINSLKNIPESRRHIVTAIDPVHDQDLALYWCHAMFQFNCRPIPLSQEEQKTKNYWDSIINSNSAPSGGEIINYENYLNSVKNKPKYYLDCHLYQRSADVILGVPYNIASYALLTHIIAKICNMIPGEFIHTFGDVHVYDNHKEAIEEQLKRTPTELPTLKISDEFNLFCSNLNKLNNEEFVKEVIDQIKLFEISDFQLENYNPQAKIKAKLSTGRI